MTPTEVLMYSLLTLAGICMSAMFSGVETGIYTINRVRLNVRAGRDDRNARRLLRELEDPNRLLGTLLIGNNIANYLGSYGIASLLAGAGFGEWETVGVNALLLTPLLFIFGETLPKDLFRTHTDNWTYGFAPVLVGMRVTFTCLGLLPIVRGVGALASRLLGQAPAEPQAARQRMAQLIREGAGAGVISESQTTLAERALRLRKATIAGELVPWLHVTKLPLDATLTEREAIVKRINFTRLPVVNRSGDVVGILSTLDAVLERAKPTADLMAQPFRLPTTTTVTRALKEMRRQNAAMAIAVHPQTGRPLGIVTLKDLVEPLTGELGAW